MSLNTSQISFATRLSRVQGDVLAEEYVCNEPVDPEDRDPRSGEGPKLCVHCEPGAPAPSKITQADADLTFDLDLEFTPGTGSPPYVPPALSAAPRASGEEATTKGDDAAPEIDETAFQLAPISLSSDRSETGGSKFSQAVARYRAQGFDFFEIAAKLMLSVLKKKEALLNVLSEIDGSWQASAAWIADMIKEEETRDAIIDALFLLMDGERIKGRPDLIARHDEILAACARIRASGRHRRDQLIMRLGSVQDEIGVISEKHSGAARLCVPVVMHKEERETGEAFLFVAHPMTGFQRNLKKTLLAMGDFGRNKIVWHQTEDIEKLFKTMQAAVLADERIQEVVFYWETEGERRIALALMNILATLWNVPAFGRGEMDFVYMESARMAAIRITAE